jgi:membrane protease YdiL (CAAX protease family)
MDSESQAAAANPAPEAQSSETVAAPAPDPLNPSDQPYRGLRWAFIGSQGLRAGWSVAIFVILTFLFMAMLGEVAAMINKRILQMNSGELTPPVAIAGELVQLLALLGAGVLVALIERRRIVDYNLTGPRRIFHFVSGLAAGFVALSALVGAMAWGGWLHFGPVALSGERILVDAAAWGTAFLVTGMAEEGAFRCYLQFTLTRGINFWWALALVAAMCLGGILATTGEGAWGVYAIALLGLAPCLLLHLKKTEGSGFWQAAWVTSTFFGFIHLSNSGENWIGIFAAALVGFVFCVSVRLTGSAWWAIGCHAAWDWAETYFYGTADSGMVAKGHLLTTNPAGSALMSGGTDGPEGSLLILPIILLLLAAILALYGRRRHIAAGAHPMEQSAG